MAQEPQEQEEPSLTAIVGANVYRLRVLHVPKWSREKLVEETKRVSPPGVSEETIRKLEGARYPGGDATGVQLSTVEILAKAFGVPPHELLMPTRVFLPGKSSASLKVVQGNRGDEVKPVQGVLARSVT